MQIHINIDATKGAPHQSSSEGVMSLSYDDTRGIQNQIKRPIKMMFGFANMSRPFRSESNSSQGCDQSVLTIIAMNDTDCSLEAVSIVKPDRTFCVGSIHFEILSEARIAARRITFAAGQIDNPANAIDYASKSASGDAGSNRKFRAGLSMLISNSEAGQIDQSLNKHLLESAAWMH
jgi:hypothetical protein